eukprot:scaffold383_cov101-Isochrysis_galbana.AAC.2
MLPANRKVLSASCQRLPFGSAHTRLTARSKRKSQRHNFSRGLPVIATGKVDRPGDQIHVEDRLGLLRRVDRGCKHGGWDVEPSGRQPDGCAGVEELMHQVARAKEGGVSRLVAEEGIEHVYVSNVFHVHVRFLPKLARPRRCARQKVFLALAAKHRCGETTEYLWKRGELQGALLHRSHRRNGRNLNWQIRFEVGVEVCGGLVAREGAHPQKALPVLVLRQLGHRK